MSRDAAGTYTLPAGNPVASDTTITATWANDTMSDIEAALTDSLSRSGKGGMTAAMKLASGSAASPQYTWTDEPGLGWYRSAAGDMRLAYGSVDVLRVGNVNGGIQWWNGSGWVQLWGYNQDLTDIITGGATGRAVINAANDVVEYAYDGETTYASSDTLVLGDAGNIVYGNNASAMNITVPPQSSVVWQARTRIDIAQQGAGQVTVVAGSGVTLRNVSGAGLKTRGQYAAVSLIRKASDEWYVIGGVA